MDILTIIVLSICVLVPFVVAMVAVAIYTYPPRFASAIKDLKALQVNQLDRQLEAKPSVRLTIFILVSMIGLCLLTCLMALMIASYLNIPSYLPQ